MRYNLKLHKRDHELLQQIVEQEGTSLMELLRKGAKVVLVYHKKREKDPDAKLLINCNGETTEIVV